MAKEQINSSATQQLREVIPKILQENFSEGATFEELWDELFTDKKLAKVMLNSKKQKRLGLLQGLTNRIKSNKEENIAIIKKEDGKNYYVFYDNSIDKLTKLTSNYLNTIQNITVDEETKITKTKEKLIKEHQELTNKLMELNNKLTTTK